MQEGCEQAKVYNVCVRGTERDADKEKEREIVKGYWLGGREVGMMLANDMSEIARQQENGRRERGPII